MSIPTTTPDLGVRTSDPVRHRARVAVAAVAVLALLVGFGVGWVVRAPEGPAATTGAVTSTVPSEVTSEVEALLDDFVVAFTAGDTAAVMSLMLPDGRFNLNGCVDARVDDPSNAGAAACVDRFSIGTFVSVDTPILISDGPPYEVAKAMRAAPTKEGPGADPTSPYFAPSNMVALFTIVPDDSGALKIKSWEKWA